MKTFGFQHFKLITCVSDHSSLDEVVFPCLLWFCDVLAGQLMVVYSILVDLSPTFYCLPKPLLVYGSMLLLSRLILSSYGVIVVMLE